MPIRLTVSDEKSKADVVPAIADLRLVGKKAVLRRLCRDDAEDVVRWRSQPQVADQLFSPPPTLDEHLRWFEATAGSKSRQEFVICARTAAGEVPVGTIGLSLIDARHRRAEYGILLGETLAVGQGLAAEASALLLTHAFETLDLHRVFLQLFHDNVRALRLYERLGFVTEGVLRDHAVRRGAYVDVVVMGLLRDEWLQHQS
jgi:UDP-4-amino-4,6-dideoxy-N-acetyl-beta-L-altrosamine N-acetyltransferase